MSSETTYSQRLEPTQVQRVFDRLNIPWRDYEPNPEGWIQVDDVHFINSVHEAGYKHVGFAKPSLNIKHGGYIDHLFNGISNTGDIVHPFPDKAIKGDIVDLVKLFLFGVNQSEEAPKRAIEWIQEVLGTRSKPELKPYQRYAKDVIANKEEHYVMVPKSVWQSTEINASAKLVWMAIQERCGKGRHYSFPSISKISKDTSLGKSTVQRAISDLKDSGFLVEISRGDRKSPKRFPLAKINLNQNTM